MTFWSNYATQRDQIFNMIKFMETPSLFFYSCLFIHHFLLAVLSEENINLDLFCDKNILIKNEWCKYVMINPKVQSIFVHTIV